MIRVNVNGRMWELGPEMVGRYPITVEERCGAILLKDNQKFDHLYLDTVMRGDTTSFFVGLEDNNLYYVGGDPYQASDGMIFAPKFAEATSLSGEGGTVYWAMPLFDLEPFYKAAVRRWGEHAEWRDENDNEDDWQIGEANCSYRVNRFTARDLLEIGDPEMIVDLLLERDEAEYAQVFPEPAEADLDQATILRRMELVQRVHQHLDAESEVAA